MKRSFVVALAAAATLALGCGGAENDLFSGGESGASGGASPGTGGTVNSSGSGGSAAGGVGGTTAGGNGGNQTASDGGTGGSAGTTTGGNAGTTTGGNAGTTTGGNAGSAGAPTTPEECDAGQYDHSPRIWWDEQCMECLQSYCCEQLHRCDARNPEGGLADDCSFVVQILNARCVNDEGIDPYDGDAIFECLDAAQQEAWRDRREHDYSYDRFNDIIACDKTHCGNCVGARIPATD